MAPPIVVRNSKRPLIFALIGLVLLLGAGLGAAVYFYVRATVGVVPSDLRPHNLFEAEAANKNIKRFEDSLKINRRGFIRFTQDEVNAHLQQRYIIEGAAEAPAARPQEAQLLRTHLSLRPDTSTWYCWVHRKWYGLNWRVVWQRTLQLARTTNQWTVKVQSMRIGNIDVPPQHWPLVQRVLGGADDQLESLTAWLAQIPALEVVTNTAIQSFDLKLYNYPEPEVLKKYNP